MTTTKRDRMYERIAQHGRALLRLFPNATERDPVKLCKRLRKIELKTHRLSEQYCNGDIDGTTWERKSDGYLCDVVAVLCPHTSELAAALFVNGDPRGYALKIRSEWVREHAPWLHQDWGGYGIIAPDLSAD